MDDIEVTEEERIENLNQGWKQINKEDDNHFDPNAGYRIWWDGADDNWGANIAKISPFELESEFSDSSYIKAQFYDKRIVRFKDGSGEEKDAAATFWERLGNWHKIDTSDVELFNPRSYYKMFWRGSGYIGGFGAMWIESRGGSIYSYDSGGLLTKMDAANKSEVEVGGNMFEAVVFEKRP